MRLLAGPLFLCLILVFEASAQLTYQLSIGSIFKEHLFSPETLEEIRSMANGEYYTVLEEDQSIASYDYKTGLYKKILFSPDILPDGTSIDDYIFSADEHLILLTTNISKIYRHSYEAAYWIFDVNTGKASLLENQGKQQLASFSPDGTKVSFVKNNNLYYRDLITDSIIQITCDGAFNRIINGAPDWVYEEEFGFSMGYTWSPDSRKIAYYRFDESEVKQFDMIEFSGIYPSCRQFKYPKAGEANSHVSVLVYHLQTGKSVSMNTGSETDQYIPRIKWTANPQEIAIIRLNRLQNKVDVLLSNATSGESRVIFHEENPKYISRVDDDFIHFTGNGENFIVLSERSGYYHYYLYTMDGKFKNPVTHGNWEVTHYLAMDDNTGTFFYKSNQPSEINTDVYSIGLNGKNQRKLSVVSGDNTAAFSRNFKYYINTWSDANTPPLYTLHHIDGSLIRVLEDNAGLKKALADLNFAKKEFIRIPVSDGLELNGYIIKPMDFDSTRKYPLFMNVYGGPESQDVINAWDNSLAWQQLLTKNGIVIVSVDNRGTDGRGEAFRKSTYLQLGKFETEDQINAAKYFGKKPWIDMNRIGIWGWSYGGTMALLCLTKGADVFSMGIAVAPVTNWRFYDNIYTERFMRRPQDNPHGYDDNSPINYADRLKGKLLMIHGTADDNVHLQNSMEMAEQLIKYDKQFQLFMYPDKNHSIYGGNTRHHLYTMMTDFILKNL
jgi:dipeptidyl-peptidase-4